MANAKTELYRMGDVIFNQGDHGNNMYEINHGLIGIYVNYGAENERCLVELGEVRDGKAEVRKGLVAGEQVVAAPGPEVQDGVPVRN